jgi:hypothetical protein
MSFYPIKEDDANFNKSSIQDLNLYESKNESQSSENKKNGWDAL